MPTWKKIVVSGSAVSQLNNDANYLTQSESGAILSGSFSGSFVGDGSQLSGVTSYTNADTLTYIDSLNVVSGSVQVDITGTTGYATFSGSAHSQRVAIETALQSDIDGNATDIATNVTNIATNVTNISTNAGDISTNASDISTNASSITSLSGSAHAQRVVLGNAYNASISSVASDLSSYETSNDAALSGLSGSAHSQRVALSSAQSTAYINADTALSSSAHVQRLAIETGLTSDISSLSGSAHSQRVAIGTTLQGNINTETGRIDAILSASSADKDSFAEIVTLINSVDTTNDNAFAGYVTSNNTRSTNIESSVTSLSSSAATANVNLSSDLTTAYTNADTALSSSAHIQRIALSSAQSTAYINADTALSSSAHIARAAVASQAFADLAGVETALQSDIDTNTSNITTNAGDISTNAGDISTNAGNITSLSGSAHSQRVVLGNAYNASISSVASDLSSYETSNDLALSNLSGSAHSQRVALTSAQSSAYINADTALSSSAHIQRVAIETGLTSDISSLSGSAHSQRVAIETALSSDIATETGRIDAILSASSADKDSFAEIVTLINSVDTANDNAFAGYVLSNNTRSTNIETSVTNLSSSAAVANTNLSSDLTTAYTNADTALSSSAHVQRVALTSAQSSAYINADTALSSSAHIRRVAINTALQSNIDGVASDLSDYETSNDLALSGLSGSAHSQRVAITTALQSNIDGVASDLSSYETSNDAALSGLSGSAHAQRVVLGNAYNASISSVASDLSSYETSNDTALAQEVSDRGTAVSGLSGSAHSQRVALASAQSTAYINADTALSSSAHSQRVAISTSLSGDIATETARIDAILTGSQADKDTFAEIVTLINSVDTTNDNAFAGYVLSNNTRSTNIETSVTNLSSSAAVANTNLSSSIATTVSGLSQTFTVAGDSGTDGIDLKTETLGFRGDGAGIVTSINAGTNEVTIAANGLLSGSAQVVASLANQHINLGTGTITGSFNGDGSNITNLTVAQAATVVDTFTNATTVTTTHNFGSRNIMVTAYDSNHAQIIPGSVVASTNNTVTVTFCEATSGRVIVGQGGHIVSGSIPFANITLKPVGLVSGSEQVVLGDVDGFTAYSSSVEAKIDALDGTFATDADLTSLSSSAAVANTNLSSDITTAYTNADTALSSSAHTQRVAIETSVTNLSSSAAVANTNLSSALTTAYGNADTALSSSIATTIAGLSSTLTIKGDAGLATDGVNLVDDQLTVSGTTGEIVTTVSNNNIKVGFVTNPTVSGNLTVTGDLTVTGNTFEAQVTNLNVEDRFILLNSGSNSGDAGIIFGGSDGVANQGSGIFFDNPASVFGFSAGIGSTDTSATHVGKLGYIQQHATNVPSGAPAFQGLGAIHIKEDTQCIYMYV